MNAEAGSSPPIVTGILETSLYVDDLERSSRFYRELFGFEPVSEFPRGIALAVPGKQVLLLFKKRASATIPKIPHDGDGHLHMAFAIAADALSAWENRLHDLGITIIETTKWERGGTSLYFRDPDGHLIELATPGLWLNY